MGRQGGDPGEGGELTMSAKRRPPPPDPCCGLGYSPTDPRQSPAEGKVCAHAERLLNMVHTYCQIRESWIGWVRSRAMNNTTQRIVAAKAMEERVETKTEQIMKGTAREARQTVTGRETAESRARVEVERDKPFEQHATENLPVVGDWLAGNRFGSAKNAVPDGTPGGKGKAGRAPDETGWGDSSP